MIVLGIELDPANETEEIDMWVFTSGGFVSAVQHRDNPDLVMVRARDRQSLETMLEGIELTGVADDEKFVRPDIVSVPGDYRWRVTVSKSTFVLFLQFEVLNYLNYDNFKNALTETRGKKWHNAAMGVWTDMLAIDDGPKAEVAERNWAFGVHGFNGPSEAEPWVEMSDEEYDAMMSEAPNA
jgi:hypothetical protein